MFSIMNTKNITDQSYAQSTLGYESVFYYPDNDLDTLNHDDFFMEEDEWRVADDRSSLKRFGLCIPCGPVNLA